MKRILVVDDDANLREILSVVLSKKDRAVDTAGDGIEAVALLNQNRYDVILSDLNMPGLDGLLFTGSKAIGNDDVVTAGARRGGGTDAQRGRRRTALRARRTGARAAR